MKRYAATLVVTIYRDVDKLRCILETLEVPWKYLLLAGAMRWDGARNYEAGFVTAVCPRRKSLAPSLTLRVSATFSCVRYISVRDRPDGGQAGSVCAI